MSILFPRVEQAKLRRGKVGYITGDKHHPVVQGYRSEMTQVSSK